MSSNALKDLAVYFDSPRPHSLIMSTELVCYNCNYSLAGLSLPLSRRDMCPACSVHLHVCRMCVAYDPDVIGQCREDDADDVLDKERLNFCEWFAPANGAFDASRQDAQSEARAQLDSLFGDEPAGTASSESDSLVADAEKLFK